MYNFFTYAAAQRCSTNISAGFSAFLNNMISLGVFRMSDSNTSPSLTLWSVDASSETEDIRMSDSNTTPSFTLRKQLVDDSSDSSDEREDLRSQRTVTNWSDFLVRTRSSSSYESGKSSELHNAPLIEECLKCSLCENVMKDPVFVPCGDTFCKTCIQKHLNEDCSCPNCCKRFERYPDLPLNKTLDRLLKQMDFSHALPAHSYAGPGDVACDICTGKKIRASKSCLTCDVSYCETHVRHHYTLEAFSHHVLVDATKDLKQNICQQDDGGLDELILPINKVTII
ncbi:hypothetical protein C0J45_22209 [Silurus meridionalis]|nr:hypothetical protein C0J45_22209 [Silurus meridionalis]